MTAETEKTAASAPPAEHPAWTTEQVQQAKASIAARKAQQPARMTAAAPPGFDDMCTGRDGVCAATTGWRMQVNPKTKAAAFTCKNEHGVIAYVIRELPDPDGKIAIKVIVNAPAGDDTIRLNTSNWTCTSKVMADQVVKASKHACTSILRLPA